MTDHDSEHDPDHDHTPDPDHHPAITTPLDEIPLASIGQPPSGGRILLTGATGYVGGRLAPLLLERGYEVVCLVRRARKLERRDWSHHERAIIVEGDVSNTEHLAQVMRRCDIAYYLIHAMESGVDDFAERDRCLAESFAQAASMSRLQRIIYLGGLGEMGDHLSEHLRSRREVEDILRSSGVPTTAFRAAMIIGSGSASFEILRYLVERLPVMVTPRWVTTECQPISIVDVLGYLTDCLSVPETADCSLEIGGPEVLTYRALMDHMAAALELPRRIVIPLPVLTPKLSSMWIGLVTPVNKSIARPLAEGLRNPVTVQDTSAQELMPRETMTPKESIERALVKVRSNDVVTRWSAAGRIAGDPDWAGGTMFVDRRSLEMNASPEDVFAAVCRVGGGHGWYAADILWKIRGLGDQIFGGPGLRRGRRHPELVEYGEALDFWRVEDVEPGKRLYLRAEMKLPGIARLEFEIDPVHAAPADDDGDASGPTNLTMTARFQPKGLLGLAYWFSVLPFHNLVFKGMLRGMKRTAESIASGAAPPSERQGSAAA